MYQTNINNYVDQIDLRSGVASITPSVKSCCRRHIAGGRYRHISSIFTLRRIRQQVVRPLNQLVTRLQHTVAPPPLDTSLPNELGLLAKTFSQMSSELHKLYRSLEASVEEKRTIRHEAHPRRPEVLAYQCSGAEYRQPTPPFRHILQIVREHDAARYLELTGR